MTAEFTLINAEKIKGVHRTSIRCVGATYLVNSTEREIVYFPSSCLYTDYTRVAWEASKSSWTYSEQQVGGL